jgi:hypothetical protein
MPTLAQTLMVATRMRLALERDRTQPITLRARSLSSRRYTARLNRAVIPLTVETSRDRRNYSAPRLSGQALLQAGDIFQLPPEAEITEFPARTIFVRDLTGNISRFTHAGAAGATWGFKSQRRDRYPCNRRNKC